MRVAPSLYQMLPAHLGLYSSCPCPGSASRCVLQESAGTHNWRAPRCWKNESRLVATVLFLDQRYLDSGTLRVMHEKYCQKVLCRELLLEPSCQPMEAQC